MSTIAASTTSGTAFTVTADTTGALVIQTGATPTTAVTVDSSGNVGIGTSSPATKFQVSGVSSSISGAITASMHSDGTNGIFQTDGPCFLRSTTSNPLVLGTNNTERMRIDSSGNVGIGVTPSTKFDVVGNGRFTGTTNSVKVTINNTGGETTVARDDSTGSQFGVAYATNIYATGAYPMLFWTNGTERMRITDAGEVWIAKTTDAGAFNLQCGGTGVWGAGAYTNGSDARIKEDIAPIESGLEVVAKLKPVTYRYKEDWSKDQSIQPGFIAQELLVALEGQNYVEGVVSQGGSEGYYSVAYQNIIPILTKAIQEQQGIIEQLTARVAALESKGV